MAAPILATKLYIPPPRPHLVTRPRLIKRLNDGMQSMPSVTLISAPAGFGKTTLLSEWISQKEEDGRMNASRELLHPSKVSWLSLDEGDNDPARFLIYLISALQKTEANLGVELLGLLPSPQTPPLESILTSLLNEMAA